MRRRRQEGNVGGGEVGAGSWYRERIRGARYSSEEDPPEHPLSFRWDFPADRVKIMSVEVEVVRETTDEVVGAVARLLPQLSSNAGPPTYEDVDRLLRSEANTLLVARIDGLAVGMLTLITYPLPSGLRCRIEDVVVDDAARGHGAGAALTSEALRLAEAAGARTVDLTSRPSREAANRLYERLGFQGRDSKVYRFTVQS